MPVALIVQKSAQRQGRWTELWFVPLSYLLGRRRLDDRPVEGLGPPQALLATVPVEITCGPIEVDPRFTEAFVELNQAVKRQIAHGFGSPNEPIVCDGTPHANTFTVLADTSGPPFRKGDAAVEVFVRVGNETECCISGSSGIQIIRFR
jgi:hypothetical protein